MIVYGASFSPFVRKVLAFGGEKGIEVENKIQNPAAFDPEFLEASPFRKIPALRDGDFLLCESTAIVTYFDALRPEPNLIPLEPRARARTIWFEEYVDTIVVPVGLRIFFNRVVAPMVGAAADLGAAERAARDDLPPVLDYLESQIPESGWLVEDRYTLADLACANPVATLAYAGWSVDEARHPKIKALAERVLSRPVFAALLERERRFFARVRPQAA